MSNGRQAAPNSFDRRGGPVCTFLLLALYCSACNTDRPSSLSFGSIADAKQVDTTCEIPHLPADVTFLTGPDPITEAELIKWPIEKVLPPCLFSKGADVQKCASYGWNACETCVDANCLLCTSENGIPWTSIYWPVCEESPCTFEHMSSLVSATQDECAVRLSWDALPENAGIWLNPDLLEGEVCANRTRTRFWIRGCGAQVKVRQIGFNNQASYQREAILCVSPPGADIWSAEFPYRRCTAASWAFDSAIAAADPKYDPARPDVFRYAGALCVQLQARTGIWPLWRPETPEELAGLKTDGCDPK